MKNTNLDRMVYALIGIVICALPWLCQAMENTFWLKTLCLTMLFVMLAQGLNIVVGMAGLLDLGYIGFYAIGAYTYALSNSNYLAEHFATIKWLQSVGFFPWGLMIVMPVGALLAAGAGALFGYPTLKLRGDYLAIVTLGFGEIIQKLINNLTPITGGAQGISNIAPVSTFGKKWEGNPFGTPRGYLDFFGISVHPYTLYYLLFFIVVVFTLIACSRLQNSRLGRSWMALREDEIAAKAMGIDIRNVKLLAFAIGASFAGVAGALFAALNQAVAPDSFDLNQSIMVVAMMVFGGIGHIRGVLMGAILLSIIPSYLTSIDGELNAWQAATFSKVIIEAAMLKPLIFALSLILIMLFRPKGVWPASAHGNNKSMVKGASA